MSETHLYLMRHGETDWNAQGFLQGRSDIPLSETGRRQAETAKTALHNINFDTVYASPLCRALETASIVSGLAQGDIQIDDRLIEVSFGESEGKPAEQFSPSIKTFFASPGQYEPIGDTENFASVFCRTESFLRFVARKHTGETLLAASHGAAIACITNCVRNWPIEQLWDNLLGNCSLVHLVLQDEAWQLEEIINPLGSEFVSPYQR